MDSDGDGQVDAIDPDDDNDGIPDALDNDGGEDGVPNNADGVMLDVMSEVSSNTEPNYPL